MKTNFPPKKRKITTQKNYYKKLSMLFERNIIISNMGHMDHSAASVFMKKYLKYNIEKTIKGDVNIDNSVQSWTEKLHKGTKTIQKSHNYVIVSKYSIPACGSLKQQCRIFNYIIILWLSGYI